MEPLKPHASSNRVLCSECGSEGFRLTAGLCDGCYTRAQDPDGVAQRCPKCKGKGSVPLSSSIGRTGWSQSCSECGASGVVDAIPNSAATLRCAHCGGDAGDNWFDRTLCPEPCGGMHTRCSNCGNALDGCPLEHATRNRVWSGPVAWRHWGNMTPSPPAPKPYTQGAGPYPAAGADDD